MANTFGWLFIKRFCRLLSYLNGIRSNFLMLISLLVWAALEEFAAYNIGMITGTFYKVLGDKDKNGFYRQLTQSILLIIGIAIVKSVKDLTANHLYLGWRNKLTHWIHSLYFTDILYYNINVIDNQIDNPDQRITQDVEKMCNKLSAVIPTLILFPFVLVFYTYTSYNKVGWIGPVGCFGFFIIASTFTKLLMNPIVGLVYEQEKREGFFRYQHMHVRSNAESIAFSNGGNFEFNKSEQQLDQLIAVQIKLIFKKFYLALSIYFFDYAGSIVSFIVIAIPLFAGAFDHMSTSDLAQLISQNAFVSIYLINVFTRIIDLSDNFTLIAGTTHRIGQLIEYLNKKREKLNFERSLSSSSATVNIATSDGLTYFRLNDVTIQVPNIYRRLTERLTFGISSGENLLISGPSGSCKTSILRVIKGLWKESSGSVERFLPINDPNIVMFLPQKPTLTIGSLLDQVIYPNRLDNFTKQFFDKIIQIMRFLELNNALDLVNNEIDRPVNWVWYDKLSPGEVQRLAFVRLFLYHPMIAFLDEATSAISFEQEKKIYEECKQQNITLVTCGHRSTLLDYHDVLLKLQTNDVVSSQSSSTSSWTIQRIKKS